MVALSIRRPPPAQAANTAPEAHFRRRTATSTRAKQLQNDLL